MRVFSLAVTCMNLLNPELLEESWRVLLLALLPTVLVPLACLGFTFVQGLLALREDSSLYAVRALVLVGVVAVFGVPVCSGLVRLLELALR